ncbi:MAG TPA: hypothetical protein VFL42_03130 [Terriglobales bacterium]|nr:hypothetical protein [Terriglobales bacterium]
MRRVLLLVLAFMSLAIISPAYGQAPSDESALAARNRSLEKTVQAQKLRIASLQKQLRTRDEEVHMLVKIVSKQSDKDSSDEGSASSDSSSCDSSPVVRARSTHRAHLKVARTDLR